MEHQPNLVHFSLKICHLVAGYAVGLQIAAEKYWCRAKCKVCPTNPTTALLAQCSRAHAPKTIRTQVIHETE